MNKLAVTLGLLATYGNAICADFPNYPTRPLRIIVPFSAGGGTDVLARMLGKHLTDVWGQQVVIDNRPGGGGVIAAEMVAKANADGHTLLMVAIGHAVNPSLMGKLPYDTQRDFQPVSLTASLGLVLAVHPTIKAASVPELIALAKSSASSTKALVYASGGIGSSQHLAAELLASMAKIKWTHVPYKGGAPAMIDLLSGQAPVMITSIMSVAPHGRAGRLRMLGVASAKRNSTVPEVPTIAEAGVPGYESIAWYGLIAPAGLPPAVLDKLANEVIKGTRSKAMHEALVQQGGEPVGSGPKDFAAFIQSEMSKYARVIRESGMKPE